MEVELRREIINIGGLPGITFHKLLAELAEVVVGAEYIVEIKEDKSILLIPVKKVKK